MVFPVSSIFGALKTEITEKTEQLGLYCSPEVNFHEYGIDVKLKYIRFLFFVLTSFQQF